MSTSRPIQPMVTLGLLVLVALLFASAVAVPLYQCRLHPMARLSRTLSDARDLETFQAAFVTYMSGREPRSVRLMDSPGDPSTAPAGVVAWARRMALYEEAIADPVQLIADFDEAGTLIQSSYVCD